MGIPLVGLALLACGVHVPVMLLPSGKGSDGDQNDSKDLLDSVGSAIVGFFTELAGGRYDKLTAAEAEERERRLNHHILCSWLRCYGRLVARRLTVGAGKECVERFESLCGDAVRLGALESRLDKEHWMDVALNLPDIDQIHQHILGPFQEFIVDEKGERLFAYGDYLTAARSVMALDRVQVETEFVSVLVADPIAKDKFLVYQSLQNDGRKLATAISATTKGDIEEQLKELGIHAPTPEQVETFSKAVGRLVERLDVELPKLSKAVIQLSDAAEAASSASGRLDGATTSVEETAERLKKFVDGLEQDSLQQKIAQLILAQLEDFKIDVDQKFYRQVDEADAFEPVRPDDYLELPPNPWSFYSGGIASWADIAHEIDFKRDIADRCYASIAADPTPHSVKVVLIHSRSGEGKTTLMRRLAYDLAFAGQCCVWLHDPQKLSFAAIGQVRTRAELGRTERLYLFVDRFGNVGEEAVELLVERLKAEGKHVTLIGADVDSQIGNRYQSLQQNAALEIFSLLSFSEDEGDRLFERLREHGLLTGPHHKVREKIRRGRELIVALIEALSGANFGKHIRDEINRKKAQVSPELIRVIVAIAQLHQADEEIPSGILKRRFPDVDLELLRRNTEGMLFEVRDSTGWRTRHRLIAAEIAKLAEPTNDPRKEYGDGYEKWVKAYSDAAPGKCQTWLRRLGEYGLIAAAHELLAACEGILRDRQVFQALLKFESWRCHGSANDAPRIAEEVRALLTQDEAQAKRRYSNAYQAADRISSAILYEENWRRGGCEHFLEVSFDLFSPVHDLDAGQLLRDASVHSVVLPKLTVSTQSQTAYEHLKKAVELEPTSSLALMTLGALERDLVIDAGVRWDTCSDITSLSRDAYEHLNKAVVLDSSSSFARVTLGALERDLAIDERRRWDGCPDLTSLYRDAYGHLKKAVELNPASNFSLAILGVLERDLAIDESRRWDGCPALTSLFRDAYGHLKKAVELDPAASFSLAVLGVLERNLAIDEGRRWDGCPDIATLCRDAHEHVTQAVKFDPSSSFAKANLLVLLLAEQTSLEPGKVRELLSIYECHSGADFQNCAFAWLALGEKERATEYRHRARELFRQSPPKDYLVEEAAWDAFELDTDEALAALKALLNDGARSHGMPFWVLAKHWPKQEDADMWQILIEVCGTNRDVADLDAWPRWRNLP